MRAAELLVVVAPVRSAAERGGCIGKVLAIVDEHPGLLTRDIAKLVGGEDAEKVSGALNKLKLEERITQEWVRPSLCRWYGKKVAGGEPPRGSFAEVLCACGQSILFGSLAAAAERADPTCTTCSAEIAALASLRR